VHVGDGHQGVVERCEDVRDAGGNVLRALGFDDFLARQIIGQQLGGGRSGNGRRGSRSARAPASPGLGVSPAGAAGPAGAGAGAAACFLAGLASSGPEAFGAAFSEATASGLPSFFGAAFFLGSSAMSWVNVKGEKGGVSGCRSWRSDCAARPRSCAGLCACARWLRALAANGQTPQVTATAIALDRLEPLQISCRSRGADRLR